MGGSSSQCLTKSFDVYLRSANRRSCSELFSFGMRHAEELCLPLVNTLPPLPPVQVRTHYLNVFFGRIHPLFPMFDIDKCKNGVHELASLPEFSSSTSEIAPHLASAYLIMSLGADEAAVAPTEDGSRYFKAAVSLFGHVILMPYLASVQTLILYTIRYRAMNKDGMGWQAIGIAIRIAHTLGLHRHSVLRPSREHGIQQRSAQLFHARIWAICCCLEKIMQLECGRPSSITSVDCDQMMGSDQRAPGHDFLQWHMSLAQYQNDVSRHIYGNGQAYRDSGRILADIVSLDAQLTSWVSQIPADFRPGNDLLCQSEDYHFAAHLSINYHQTMIALHRAALVSSSTKFNEELAKHTLDATAANRLRKGESICLSSARSIAKITLDLHDANAETTLLNIGPPLLACIVLGIYLVKRKPGRMAIADLEVSCATMIYHEYIPMLIVLAPTVMCRTRV